MENNIIFQKLTPTDTVKMEVYEDAFKYIFGNSDIKNVAIAGPYSAGKSSLLESYKKEHKNKRFLHISLAHFEDTSGQNDRDNVKDTETVLEGKNSKPVDTADKSGKYSTDKFSCKENSKQCKMCDMFTWNCDISFSYSAFKIF